MATILEINKLHEKLDQLKRIYGKPLPFICYYANSQQICIANKPKTINQKYTVNVMTVSDAYKYLNMLEQSLLDGYTFGVDLVVKQKKVSKNKTKTKNEGSK